MDLAIVMLSKISLTPEDQCHIRGVRNKPTGHEGSRDKGVRETEKEGWA